MRRPSVLNGELFTFFMAGGKEKLRFYEQYQNGRLTVAKEFFYQESDTTGEVNVFYYDSLFNNIPTSYLFYKEDKRIPLYTQYVGRKKTLSNVKYLVKHNDFKFKYRPILGYSAGLDKSKDKNLRTKDFLELGITRRYLKGVYIDTTKKTYHDKFGTWHAFNFSFLGNISKGQFLFGQKLTYSYSFSLLRVEAGLINYTNFTKNDLRLMVGLGLSAIGYFNESI